jgi:PAS domain-containing protein
MAAPAAPARTALAEMQQQLVKAQLALERDYEAQREIDTRYRVLMETTRDAVIVVSMTTGRIVDLNLASAVLLGGSRQDMVGAAIAQEFEGRRPPSLDLFLQFVGLSEEEFMEVAMQHQVSPYVHDPAKTLPGTKMADFDRWSRDGAMARVDADELLARWRARKATGVPSK